MMGTFRVVLALMIGVCIISTLHAAPSTEDFAKMKCYPTKYDGIDYKSILKSKRLLTNYVKCLLNEGPCTAEGQMLKELLPDAISTECSKCNMKQRKGTLDVIDILRAEHPEDWKILNDRWDPEHTHTEPLLAKLRASVTE